MGQTLSEIAEELKSSNKKKQLIYAFNGTGKTRLSRTFKELIAPKDESAETAQHKILYYNAFTEDLFYWDNDLDYDINFKLKIQPNFFTNWILKDQGQDQNIISVFQRHTNNKLTPNFNTDFAEVTFSIESGDTERTGNLKISKGEESLFIWSIFQTLLEQVISTLNIAEPGHRDTNEFDHLEYVFIDDPVSSLDDNHLIELAVELAKLIKSSPVGPKYIITTHNPLFYNVLFNSLKASEKHCLERNEDGSFSLENQKTDSPFSYHLHLIETLKSASEHNSFEKYHYNLLRNILEKLSTFLGYDKWSDLLPKTQDGENTAYLKRIIDISSHSKHSGYEPAELSENDKRVLRFLLDNTTNKAFQLSKKYQIEKDTLND